MANRFRGFYPVVIDVETGGFDTQQDAILECAGVMIEMDEQGLLIPGATIAAHIEPYPGTHIDPASLAFTGIRLESALRMAVTESVALKELFQHINAGMKKYDCQRGVLVGHNAWFDREFLKAATRRNHFKRDPLHPFTSFDTATLAGIHLGHTVLAKALALAGIDYDNRQAHSAIYDAECTAKLFCYLVNRCMPTPT
jgi:ribonuclease T